MSNYSTLSHCVALPVLQLVHPSFQLTNICYENTSHKVIGGELSADEYDRMYDTFMGLHASRGNIPNWIYGRNGDIQVDISEVIEDTDLFVTLARDKKGSQFIQQKFPNDRELCAFLFECLLESDLIFPLSKDVFGNFVIQKIIEEADDYANEIFNHLKPHFYFMCKNRYSCRVAQKMISIYPTSKVIELLSQIRGHEVELVTDMHASHVVQKIVTSQSATTFGFIVNALTSRERFLKEVILNKYGCRVVQMCLDRLVCISQKSSTNKSFALSLLNKLLRPIIKYALEFSMDEYANYVVQFIIATDYLEEHRREIIQKVILTNVLKFSQARFASHVLEKSLIFASPKCLFAIIEEIFVTSNANNCRDTLNVMLFDQFGNYVIQRLLEILIEVKNGNRPGDPIWFDLLAKRLIENEQHLFKYSSGKKIIEVLEVEIGPFSENENHH